MQEREWKQSQSTTPKSSLLSVMLSASLTKNILPLYSLCFCSTVASSQRIPNKNIQSPKCYFLDQIITFWQGDHSFRDRHDKFHRWDFQLAAQCFTSCSTCTGWRALLREPVNAAWLRFYFRLTELPQLFTDSPYLSWDQCNFTCNGESHLTQLTLWKSDSVWLLFILIENGYTVSKCSRYSCCPFLMKKPQKFELEKLTGSSVHPLPGAGLFPTECSFQC